jgi:hypothetical protein
VSTQIDAAQVEGYLNDPANLDQDRRYVAISAATGLTYQRIEKALGYLRDNPSAGALSLVGSRAGVKFTRDFTASQQYHYARTKTAVTQLRRDLRGNVRPMAASNPQMVPNLQRLEMDIQRVLQDISLIESNY